VATSPDRSGFGICPTRDPSVEFHVCRPIHVKSSIETIPQSAFVYELVKILNMLTGSNYQLNFDHSDESQRAAIVKAARERLAKQKKAF